MKRRKIKKEVKAKVGQTIDTIYGPSLVIGIIIDDDGEEIIHLKEDGTKDYCVVLESWSVLLNGH